MSKPNLYYADIKHSDWLQMVVRLGTANQSALFHATLEFAYDIGASYCLSLKLALFLLTLINVFFAIKHICKL